MFQYILDCKELGCSQLDPWNVHLSELREGDAVIEAGRHPDASGFLTAADTGYIDAVRKAADEAEMPFGMIAVDGAHIYEEDEKARAENRARAYRWLDVAERLGAKQVRIDAGGPEEMPDEVFEIIREGYLDIIARAGEKGLSVVVENHWGPTQLPENVVKLLDEIPGLGYLFDTHNWEDSIREKAWDMCAHRADATHIKTFEFDGEGRHIGEDVETAIGLLLKSGYKGVWGVESVPTDGDEIEGARKTMKLIEKAVASAR